MQLQILDDTNWTLIVSIVAGSAILAYLGDVLGSRYGKQRISLFGLRPKSTSRIITAFTGMFISVAILTIMSFFSQNVRAALFTMKVLEQQKTALQLELRNNRADLEDAQMDLASGQARLHSISEELRSTLGRLTEQQAFLQTTAVSLDMTRFELERSRNDRDLLLSEKNDLLASVTSLREESEELKRELEVMRLETIVLPAGSLVGQKPVAAGASRDNVRDTLASLEDDVRATLAVRFAERRVPVSGDIVVSFDPMEESDFVQHASDTPDRLYLRALAAENIAVGENVRVRLEYGRSYLLYDEGEILYRKLLNPGEPGFNAEDELHIFLRELRNRATRSGVISDPATNSVGSLEGEDFFDAVDRIKSRNAPVIVNAVALENIYTEGPVRIKIELE